MVTICLGSSLRIYKENTLVEIIRVDQEIFSNIEHHIFDSLSHIAEDNEIVRVLSGYPNKTSENLSKVLSEYIDNPIEVIKYKTLMNGLSRKLSHNIDNPTLMEIMKRRLNIYDYSHDTMESYKLRGDLKDTLTKINLVSKKYFLNKPGIVIIISETLSTEIELVSILNSSKSPRILIEYKGLGEYIEGGSDSIFDYINYIEEETFEFNDFRLEPSLATTIESIDVGNWEDVKLDKKFVLKQSKSRKFAKKLLLITGTLLLISIVGKFLYEKYFTETYNSIQSGVKSSQQTLLSLQEEVKNKEKIIDTLNSYNKVKVEFNEKNYKIIESIGNKLKDYDIWNIGFIDKTIAVNGSGTESEIDEIVNNVDSLLLSEFFSTVTFDKTIVGEDDSKKFELRWSGQ